MVTPETRICQKLLLVQLAQFLQESGNSWTGLQSKNCACKGNCTYPNKDSRANGKPTEVEDDIATAARKHTYSAGGAVLSLLMADVVKGNCTVKQGMNLNFYFPEMKDGV